MSNWSMLLACQGYVYDGPAAAIGFKPKWQPEDHSSFFTAAEGWGLFTQKRESGGQLDCIKVANGSLRVQTLVFEMPEGAKATAAGAAVATNDAAKDLSSKFVQNGREVRITLAEPVVVKAGQYLSIEIATGK
jgi:hypothetical protein